MSDYFNMLGGTSLFMKSDSDGTKDGFYNKMPLGIKSPSEGIQHFTNWQNISDTLERDNLVRLEDDEVNKVVFAQGALQIGRFDLVSGFSFFSNFAECSDAWRHNKVKILDDVAFVAQEEYTDVVREDINLGGLSFYQYAIRALDTADSGGRITDWRQIIGSLVAKTNLLPPPDDTSYSVETTTDIDPDGNQIDRTLFHFDNLYKHSYRQIRGSSLFTQDYQNCILKLTLGEKNYYLVYGGPLPNDFHNLYKQTQIGLNFNSRLVFGRSDVSDDDLVGANFTLGGQPLSYCGIRNDSRSQYLPRVFYDSLAAGKFPGDPSVPARGAAGGISQATKEGDPFWDGAFEDGAVIGTYHLVPQHQTEPQPFNQDHANTDPDNIYTKRNASDAAEQLFNATGFDGRDLRFGKVNLGKDTHGKDACFDYTGGPVGIQLNLRKGLTFQDLEAFNKESTPEDPIQNQLGPFSKYAEFIQNVFGEIFNPRDPDQSGDYSSKQTIQMYRAGGLYASATLIKFTPVRKCGKVDVYKRKRSFITSSISGALVSEDHGLNDGDIVEINGVLLSESATNFDSKHPLNGTKYVRVVNKDRFIAYDDSVLSKISNIDNIRGFDGITWKAISHVGFQSGQGWKFHGSLFSPTGKNGYRCNELLTGSQSVEETFFTTNKLDPATSQTKQVELWTSYNKLFRDVGRVGDVTEATMKGGVYLDFTIENSRTWASSWAKNLDESIPFSNNRVNHTGEGVGDGPAKRSQGRSTGTQIFGNKGGPFFDPRKSFVDYFNGSFFGCDLDVKFSHKDGSTSHYVLVVGERGAEHSVDLFGVTEGYADITKDSIDGKPKVVTLGKSKVVPVSLPRGKTHVFRYSLDQYNNINEFVYENCLFGGGEALDVRDQRLYNEGGVVKRWDSLKERNPWSFLESINKGKNRSEHVFSDYSIIHREYADSDAYSTERYSAYTEDETKDIWHSNYWGRAAAVHWAPLNISEWRVNSFLDRSVPFKKGMGYHLYHHNDSVFYYGFDRIPRGGNPNLVELGQWADRSDNLPKALSARSFGTVIPNIKPRSIFGGEDIVGNNPPLLNRDGLFNQDSYYDSVFFARVGGDGGEFFKAGPNGGTLTFTPYETVEREYNSTYIIPRFYIRGLQTSFEDADYYYAIKSLIFPYVDSFGKSVALKMDKNLQDPAEGNITVYDVPKAIVVSASTCRGNAPFRKNSVKHRKASLDFSQEELKGEENQSEIGQLQANFLYDSNNGFKNMDFMYINSGGSDCGRFFKNLTLKQSKISDTPFAGPGAPIFAGDEYQRALRPGSPAGFGYREVSASCHLSAMHVEWVGNQLIWADQELYNNRSVINILDFDDTADRCFTPSSKISKGFIDERYIDKFGLPTAVNTGDGFGIDFRFDGELLVTNSRSKETELGLDIKSQLSSFSSPSFLRASSYDGLNWNFVDGDIINYSRLGNNHLDFFGHWFASKIALYGANYFDNDIRSKYGFDRIDLLNVYEKTNLGFVNQQQISATIDKNLLDYYSAKVLYGSHSLLHLEGTVNYSGNSVNSVTWNIDFQDRYEISDGRIIFKDVLEYCLFDRNHGVLPRTKAVSPTSATVSCFPYLAVSEDTTYGRKYFSDTSLQYNYVAGGINEYECASYSGPVSSFNTSKTPVIYFNIDLDDTDGLDSVTIDFEIDDESIFSQFDLVDLESRSSSSERTDNIIPRLVVYGQDPRSTIIKNGPEDDGSPVDRKNLSDNSTRPTYEQGIYTGAPYNYSNDFTYYGYNFPGAFRGGAQDLFFYYRWLDADEWLKNNGNINTNSTNLPDKDGFLVSGSDGGLGGVFDATSGRRLDGAGDPRFYSLGEVNFRNSGGGNEWNRNIDIDSRAYRSRFRPLAKLFMPTATADGYSVTIEASDLRELLIDGSIIKDEDRPNQFFNSFNDSDNRYGSDTVKRTLAIGFVLTNLTREDGITTWEDPTSFNMGPVRTITERRGNHRYPYQPHVNFFHSIDTTSLSQPYEWNGKQINYSMRAKVRNVSATLSKVERPTPRYTNKYHKAATFSWHDLGKEAARQVDELLEVSIVETGGTYDNFRGIFKDFPRYFGTDKLVPVPNVSAVNEWPDNSLLHKVHFLDDLRFENPIISISKDSEAFPFLDDREVITTETTKYSLSRFRREPTTRTNIYLDKETGNIVFDHGLTGDGFSYFNDDRNTSEFKQRNFLGSFDIKNAGRNKFLPLFINSTANKNKDIPLFVNPHDVLADETNAPTLFVNGVGMANNDATLFIGVRSENKDTSLFIDTPYFAGMSMFTYETAPSGAIPLFHRGPTEEAKMTLTFAKPPSGLAPLFTKGPIPEANDMRLYMVSTHQEDAPLFTDGIALAEKKATLFIDSFGVHEGDIGLTFSAGHSGVMPLFMANHNKPNAEMDLVMPSTIDEANQEMPLFISRNGHVETSTLFTKSESYFNTEDTDLSPSLFVAGPTAFSNDTDLYVSGPITGTKEELDLYVRSIFPSGDMSLVTNPLGTIAGTMPLHMASIQETMPLFLYNLNGTIIPLNITGETVDSDEKVALFMKSDISEGDLTMFTAAPKTHTISLAVGGSLDDSAAGFAPLFIGKQAHINQDATLFVQNTLLESVTPGAEGHTSDVTVSISGGLGAGVSNVSTLFLPGQPSDSGNLAASLFVKTDDPILGGGGGVLESGKLLTFIEGNNNANVYYKYNDASSLYTVNRSSDNASADLYIQRPNEFGTTLYIQSLISSGTTELYTSGAFLASNEASLYVSPPEASGLEMFTRGYLE